MTLPVTTLFFAAYRDLVGATEVELQVGEGATVADVVEALRARGDGFAALPAEPAVAVNRRYAPLSQPVAAGDEVAFIPPVAGG